MGKVKKKPTSKKHGKTTKSDGSKSKSKTLYELLVDERDLLIYRLEKLEEENKQLRMSIASMMPPLDMDVDLDKDKLLAEAATQPTLVELIAELTRENAS